MKQCFRRDSGLLDALLLGARRSQNRAMPENTFWPSRIRVLSRQRFTVGMLAANRRSTEIEEVYRVQ